VKRRGFSDEQVDRNRDLWERMLAHPLLRGMRDGALDDEVMARWMRQDYLFVVSAIPFLAALIPRGPASHWQPLARALGTLEREVRLFEEHASSLGVELAGARPSGAVHAFNEFLLATAQRASYEEAFSVLYAAHRATHESFRFVKSGLAPDSPVAPFVRNWAGREFGFYLGYLGIELDGLAEDAAPWLRERMADAFRTVVRYEIGFFDAALTGEEWPGLTGNPSRPAAGPEQSA
jgi:thiaminase/transcriptional activator TenA